MREGEGRETVVCEEFLEGREVSALAFTDGKVVVPMPPACDYKRLLDGDDGPMTGGMGGYSPAPWISEEQWAEIAATVLWPTVAGMAAEGFPFSGFLYAGIMMTAAGPRVLEYNVRLGDPEAQLLLPRLESDLVDILLAIEERGCTRSPPASAGAPTRPAASCWPRRATRRRASPAAPISGLGDLPEGVLAFHAGTRLQDAGAHWVRPGEAGPRRRRDVRPPAGRKAGHHRRAASFATCASRACPSACAGAGRPHGRAAGRRARMVNAGGRVLTLVARGAHAGRGPPRVYSAVPRVTFDGMQYRRDIGLLDPPGPQPVTPARAGRAPCRRLGRRAAGPPAARQHARRWRERPGAPSAHSPPATA